MRLAPTRSASSVLVPAIAGACLSALLADCGGGGESAGPSPVVSHASINPGPRYGGPEFIQINGTHLDANMAVTSSQCTGMTRLSSAPYISSDTVAYYSCTVGGGLTGTVLVTNTLNGQTLTTLQYTALMPQVTMHLSDGASIDGDVVIQLEAGKVPATVDNFLAYVNAGFYDNLVIDSVLVPGGLNQVGIVRGGLYQIGSTPTHLLPRNPIANPINLEIDPTLQNVAWTIAMYWTGQPNSAQSEFFFNTVDNSAHLDPSSSFEGYAVFGEILTGAAYVHAATTVPCTQFGLDGSCMPVPNVVITSARQSQ